MPMLDEVSKKSSLKNEAIHIALIGKALLGSTSIYSQNEALEILRKKMATFGSFTGRQRLTRDDQLVSWSVYGLLEILETRYAH
jgi:hypothetical protein